MRHQVTEWLLIIRPSLLGLRPLIWPAIHFLGRCVMGYSSPFVVQCPDCVYSNVQISRIRWGDWFWLLFFMRPYRCHSCGCRFHG